jgi:thymidylate synthase ThyX
MIEFRQYDYLESETKVTVICDSTSSLTGSRATTLLCRVPRFILPELNTHRVFSRNVASSRAKRF